MGYYRRGYNWEILEYFQAPTGGWNPDTPAPELPTNQAQVLDNFLIKPGKIACRGGFDVYGDFSAYNRLYAVSGVMGLPDWILIGRKAVSGSLNVDPWNAHVVQDASNSHLAQANTTALWKAAGGAVQTLALTRDNVPGPRWINFGGSLIGIGYDSTGALIPVGGAGYSVRPTSLLGLPVQQSVPTAPLQNTTSPQGGIDLKDYYSRIFVLGGTDVNLPGLGASTTVLYYTNPTPVLTGFLSLWTDPVTGTTNQLTIDDNASDPGVALARVRAGLVVFRRWSTWILRGTSPNSWQIQPVSREIGCLDARSVCESDHGVYFMSPRGLMLTDGITTRDVSGPLRTTLQNAIALYESYVRFSTGAYCTCRLTTTGAVMVSMGVYGNVANGFPADSIVPIWCGMFDTTTNTWVRVTSPIWALDGATGAQFNYPGLLLGNTNDSSRMFALGNQYLTRMEDLPNAKSFARISGMFDKMPDGTFSPIPASWLSRLSHGTDPRKKMQVKRIFADYVFQGNNIPASGWTFTPIGADRNLLSGAPGSLVVPSAASVYTTSVFGGQSVGSPSVQHRNMDLPVEAVDVGVLATWTAPSQATDAAAPVAEIHGVGYELQPTSDRRP